jgi:hypothetical protein
MLNAGVFIFKNSTIGKQCIDDCIKEYGKDGCLNDDLSLNCGYSGRCYEQGVMNVIIKSVYKDYTYVDQSRDFIYTYLDRLIYPNLNNVNFILHLAGQSTKTKNKLFKTI